MSTPHSELLDDASTVGPRLGQLGRGGQQERAPTGGQVAHDRRGRLADVGDTVVEGQAHEADGQLEGRVEDAGATTLAAIEAGLVGRPDQVR